MRTNCTGSDIGQKCRPDTLVQVKLTSCSSRELIVSPRAPRRRIAIEWARLHNLPLYSAIIGWTHVPSRFIRAKFASMHVSRIIPLCLTRYWGTREKRTRYLLDIYRREFCQQLRFTFAVQMSRKSVQWDTRNRALLSHGRNVSTIATTRSRHHSSKGRTMTAIGWRQRTLWLKQHYCTTNIIF